MTQLPLPIFEPHPLETAIGAIDRLNRWVRSRSYQPTNSGPRRAIYWLKRRAIERMHYDGEARHRRVFVVVKCRDCGGTGRWVDWEGYVHNHCRACGNTGRSRLEFIESRFLDVAWHSPVGAAPNLRGWVRDQIPPVDVTGEWAPNRPGTDLTPGEVAAALLEAEAAFPERPRYWGLAGHDYHYRLFVGDSGPACSFCGSESEDCAYCCSRGRIAWHGRACKACDRRHRDDGVNIFDAFPLPEALLVDPSVAEWVRRNRGIEPISGG